jgi:ribosomal protein L20A (L18A)
MVSQLVLIAFLAVVCLIFVKKVYEPDWRDVMDVVWHDIAFKATCQAAALLPGGIIEIPNIAEIIPEDTKERYVRAFCSIEADETVKIKLQGSTHG